MSITRKFLKSMGLTEEQVDSIIDAHTETVDGLKESVEKYRTDAEHLAAVQKELNDLKAVGDGGLQKRYDELKTKHEADAEKHKAELEALQKQIADRAYSDAMIATVKAANGGKGVKFSSKGAETAFMAGLKEKALELKDGALDKDGFEAYLKAQKDADPDAFASDTPTPRIVNRIGTGGAPAQPKSKAAELAAKYHQNLYGNANTKE